VAETNPKIYCDRHHENFRKIQEETDKDGSKILILQYWIADCGCRITITLAMKDEEDVIAWS
jgi:hypothetical protein